MNRRELAAHPGLADADEMHPRDGAPQPHEGWESDLALTDAASASAEWVFRDDASRVPAAEWARSLGR
ncbi:MAG: hypothetical protein EA421_04970 [Gemmatimonadales bacterium]|nr:MAG: hypothetical protein EA421_04970 [Gemmatimonadales bacterium]